MTDESLCDQEYEFTCDGPILAAESLRVPFGMSSLDWLKSSSEVTLDRDEAREASDPEELVASSRVIIASGSLLPSCVSKT